MFNGILSLGGVFSAYSGSPMVAAVSAATCTVNGQLVPCNDMFNFLAPFLIILAPIIIFMWLIGIAASVLLIISWWKVFKKAGHPGWPAIIPIYNLVIMFRIVGMSPWYILLNLVPWAGQIAFFVVMIFVNIKLTKAFGKEEGFAVGLILLPVVFVPILAFGQAKFVGLAPISPSNPVLPQNPVVPPTTPTSTV